MLHSYKLFLLAAIFSFSSSLICQEGDKEKIDPACREIKLNENAITAMHKAGENRPIPSSAVSDIQIMNELARSFGHGELELDEAIRMAKFLKPHMQTLAVIALCRLSEKGEVSINLVNSLITLASKEDLEKALIHLTPGDRNEYVMNAMMNKAFNRLNTDHNIAGDNEEQMFNKRNKTVLALALAYLASMDNLDAENLERARLLIEQVDTDELEIAFAINNYRNDKVKELIINKLLNDTDEKIEGLYRTLQITEKQRDIAKAALKIADEDVESYRNQINKLLAEKNNLKKIMKRRFIFGCTALGNCALALGAFSLICWDIESARRLLPCAVRRAVVIAFLSGVLVPAWMVGTVY